MAPRLPLILLIASCGGELRIDLPIDEETQSAIVAFSYEDQTFDVHAVDVPYSTVAIDYDGRAEVEISAQLYRQESCELMIPPGPLEPVSGGFALPMPSSIVRLSVDGGDANEWETLTEAVHPLAGFLLDPDPAICVRCGCVFVDTGSCDCRNLDPDRPIPPSAPLPPALPALDWSPPPIAAPGECDDEVRWYGSAECTPVGPPCPAGSWPEMIPPGSAAYVDPSAAEGGDGSRSNPFNRIDRAAGAAVVVLSKGVHPVTNAIIQDQIVIGACAAETALVGADASSSLELRNGALADVRMSGSFVLIGQGTAAELSNVIIESSPSYGVFVSENAALSANNVVIRDVMSNALDVRSGSRLTADVVVVERAAAGLLANDAVLELRRWIISESGSALELIGGATVTLEDTVLSNNGGNSIDAGDGVELIARRVAVFDSAGICAITHVNTSARFTDLVLSGCTGDGLLLFEPGADVEVSRARIERAGLIAVSAPRPGRIALYDVSIGGPGYGLSFGEVEAEVKGALIEGTVAAVSSFQTPTVRLDDVTVRRTGLFFEESHVTLMRVAVEDAPGAGLIALSSSITLGSARISRCNVDDDIGESVVFDFSRVTLRSVHLEDNQAGMFLGDFEEASLDDLSISGSRGGGLKLHLGGATMSRARIEDVASTGLWVDDKTSLVANDLTIQRIGRDEDRTVSGIDSIGTTRIERFVSSHSTGYGARTSEAGDLMLMSGEISESYYGCGYWAGYDLSRLVRNVRFTGNNFDLWQQ